MNSFDMFTGICLRSLPFLFQTKMKKKKKKNRFASPVRYFDNRITVLWIFRVTHFGYSVRGYVFKPFAKCVTDLRQIVYEIISEFLIPFLALGISFVVFRKIRYVRTLFLDVRNSKFLSRLNHLQLA